MRKTKIFIITFALILIFSTVASAEKNSVKILINGEELIIPPEKGTPFINGSFISPENRVIIPLQAVLENLGHKVDWDSITRTAVIDDKFTISDENGLIRSKDTRFGTGYIPTIKDGNIYTNLTIINLVLGYDFDYEKPNLDNKFTTIINIYKKPKPELRSTEKLVKMDTKTIVPNYNSITSVRVLTNGNSLDFAPKHGYPFIDKQGRTMIPLRIISEVLGHNVKWDDTTKTAIIDDKFSITIGENLVKTPKGNISMDTNAIIKDGKTYVPLRFIVEALGYEIEYRKPDSGNRYTHMVNILKKDMVQIPYVNPPIKDEEIYRILVDGGIIEFNPETDVDNYYGHVAEKKAKELIEALHNSINVTFNKDSIKLTFYKPDLPTGMRYSTVMEVVTKDHQYQAFYGASGPSPHVTLRDDGFIEVNYNEEDPKNIREILILSNLFYNNKGSLGYVEELMTGRKAIGAGSYLFTEEEYENVEKLYLPQYQK